MEDKPCSLFLLLKHLTTRRIKIWTFSGLNEMVGNNIGLIIVCAEFIQKISKGRTAACSWTISKQTKTWLLHIVCSTRLSAIELMQLSISLQAGYSLTAKLTLKYRSKWQKLCKSKKRQTGQGAACRISFCNHSFKVNTFCVLKVSRSASVFHPNLLIRWVLILVWWFWKKKHTQPVSVTLEWIHREQKHISGF